MALEKIREGTLSALGMEYGMLSAVDAASAAQLLGHSKKVLALARLVAEEAEVWAAQGEDVKSAASFEHALALLDEAERMARSPDPQVAELKATFEERLKSLPLA